MNSLGSKHSQTVYYYNVPYEFQIESTLSSLPECQGTPCSKQASYLKFLLPLKHSLLMEFVHSMSYYQRRNFIRKFFKKCDLKTSFRPFCVCKELNTVSREMTILKQTLYIRYVLAKISQFFQTAHWRPKIPFFYRGFLEN